MGVRPGRGPCVICGGLLEKDNSINNPMCNTQGEGKEMKHVILVLPLLPSGNMLSLNSLCSHQETCYPYTPSAPIRKHVILALTLLPS